jgi:hypothetical protein
MPLAFAKGLRHGSIHWLQFHEFGDSLVQRYIVEINLKVIILKGSVCLVRNYLTIRMHVKFGAMNPLNRR